VKKRRAGILEKSRFDWVFLNDGVPKQYGTASILDTFAKMMDMATLYVTQMLSYV
jgi:hypothetical protein